MSEFTPRAQQALQMASNEAKRSGHPETGVAHLALALLELKEGVHWNVWKSLDMDIPRFRRKVDDELRKSSGDSVPGTGAYTPRLQKLIELARQTKEDLHHPHIGTEHLFLALIDPRLEGEFCATVREMGITHYRAKESILHELNPAYKLPKSMMGPRHKYKRVISEMNLWVDPGSAPPEVIADILAHISLIYRKTGGSGITFRFEGTTVLEETFA
jgi:ATP-dependent Clp protease ATP-binding subunit ClpA